MKKENDEKINLDDYMVYDGPRPDLPDMSDEEAERLFQEIFGDVIKKHNIE